MSKSKRKRRKTCPWRPTHFHVCDSHVGALKDGQLAAYETLTGLPQHECVVIIPSGDIVHATTVHEGEYDMTRALEVMDEARKKIDEAMGR